MLVWQLDSHNYRTGATMFADTDVPCSRQVLFCDREPDSRNRITEMLSGFGYAVLSTGNPQIAAAMTHERQLAALVVSVQTFDLSVISVIGETRRHKPQLPIVVLLAERGGCNIPSGLADIVLVSPSDQAIRQSLTALTESRLPASLAS